MHSLYYGYIRLKLATGALYQAENAAIAVRCMEQIPEGQHMTGKQIEEGPGFKIPAFSPAISSTLYPRYSI